MLPYQKFGQAITNLRRKFHVTKRDFCGALEINEDYLMKLETGEERPSEELVEQVISHFSLDGKIADNLWLLAGYPPLDKLDDAMAQVAFLPLSEAKISYTDMVHVTVNNYGVVLNFMQHGGPQNQPVVVSRLGMSKEHAHSVIEVLARTLSTHSRGRGHLQLPDGSNNEA